MNRVGLATVASDPAPSPAAEHGADSPPAFASAIYEGWVRHRRHAPHPNAFRYRSAMLYLDLAEAERWFAGRWLWSRERRNLVEFRRRDYFGDPALALDEAIRRRVAADTGQRPQGPIRLLTQLRTAGLAFNPVSFYYCFAADGRRLEAIVAEITNTPWKQRHAYVLPVATASRHGGALRWDFAKRFHVSPFVPMQRDYAWRFSVPDAALRVHMDVLAGGVRELDATLVLQRRAFTPANLARVLLRFPLMTAKVVAAIHWQALRIYLRGNPVYDHPDPAERHR
jgi:DUF1365 family protein